MGIRRCKVFRREEGAAALEFAIIGTVLLVIVLGAIEWGMWVSKYQALASAAREGARVAAVQQDVNGGGYDNTTDPAAAATAAASPYTLSNTPTANKDCKTPATNEGSLVTVEWDQQMNIPQITPLPFHPPAMKHITGVFRCE